MRERKYTLNVGSKRRSRLDDLPRVQVEKEGSGMSRLLGLGLLLGAGYAVFNQWPEIQRYLKMRSM